VLTYSVPAAGRPREEPRPSKPVTSVPHALKIPESVCSSLSSSRLALNPAGLRSEVEKYMPPQMVWHPHCFSPSVSVCTSQSYLNSAKTCAPSPPRPCRESFSPPGRHEQSCLGIFKSMLSLGFLTDSQALFFLASRIDAQSLTRKTTQIEWMDMPHLLAHPRPPPGSCASEDLEGESRVIWWANTPVSLNRDWGGHQTPVPEASSSGRKGLTFLCQNSSGK
jgi:hypothetical protein